MHYRTFYFILTIFVAGCQQHSAPETTTAAENPPPENQRKIKSITSRSFITERFYPDSLVFEEKIIQQFDTSGQLIEMKQYIIDSTILYRHHFQKWAGDTLLRIEKDRGNVFKPKIKMDTLKYLNDLIIERKTTNTWRHTEKNGIITETPLPTRTYYEYDSTGKLIFTKQLHDGAIYECTYAYDAYGQLIRKDCGDGARSYAEEKYYNNKGLKTKQREISYKDEDIVAEYKRYYRYDARDSLIYQSWYRNGKNFLIYNYEFNDKGQKQVTYIYNDSSGDSTLLALQYLYYYNEKDHLKQFTIVAKNGDPMQTELYDYDGHGNRIEKRRFTHTIDLDKRAVLTRLVTRYYYEYY